MTSGFGPGGFGPSGHYTFTDNSGSYFQYGNHGFPPPKPYKWPESEPEYPVIGEGTKGSFLLQQKSLNWIHEAVDAIYNQVHQLEMDLGHPMQITVTRLLDGNHLVEWGRKECEFAAR